MKPNEFKNQFDSLVVPVLGVRLPSFIIEDKYRKRFELPSDITNFDFLRALCRSGLKELKIDKNHPQYQIYIDRAKYELGIIEELGFTDYILLVWDVINFCKENNIPTGLGRGCLNFETPVFTSNGYKPLGILSIGDKVINSSGELDEVINTMSYDCNEQLLSFSTRCDTFSNTSMTEDHKILAIKNPFLRNSQGYVSRLKHKYNFKNIFNETNFKWLPAKEINKNDYLVRYIGRKSPEKDIINIDLSIFAENFDNKFVYEKHPINNSHPLSIKTISKFSGISRNCLKDIKNKRSSVSLLSIEKLKNFLCFKNYTLDDFYNFQPYRIISYPRFLKVDEDFCYILGFYIGDGWKSKSRIGFACHSENNLKEIHKISSYFKSLNCLVSKQKHKNKKVTQIYINSRIFSSLFSSLIKGKTKEKFIPEEYLNITNNKLKFLLQGLIDSDGHETDKIISFDNTSIKLIYQVRSLLEYFGYGCCISQRNQKNCNTSFKIKTAKRNIINTHYYNDGKYLYLKVIDKQKVENLSKKVYDITVKNNPSYLSDKYIVHNSAAGSLVLNLIDVTQIDPIKYNLYFERFISKARAKKTIVNGITYLDGSLAPDVDLDICYYRRGEVLKYLSEKFCGKTSKILTFNTLSAKLLIKELGKIVGGVSEEEMTVVTSMIPKTHGIIEDLDKAYATVPEFKEWCDKHQTVYDTALKLKDLIKNKGVHPSGVMVTYNNLEDCCPTELSSDKEIVSSFDMNMVSLFSVKLDILGLRGVSVVDDVCKQLKINTKDIDINNPEIYQHLQDLRYPHGLFQLEADMCFRTAQKVKPKNLEELSAVIAVARPGASQFIEALSIYTNTGVSQSIHPFFDTVLEKTGGLCLFQEQALKMANKIGFSLDEAEQIRRCVGKKKIEEIKTWKSRIFSKVSENGLPKEIADIFWKILEDSGGYSFNASHSIAYASLSALTVYLKFKHPTEFFLSLLRMSQNEPNPIAEISKIHQEMHAFNLKLLPPSLTHSKIEFSIEGKDIRFGLASIKGVAEKTIEKLNNFKREHANKFELFESAKEAGLSIGVLSALIQAGSLAKFGHKRSSLVYEAQLWNLLKPKEKQAAMTKGLAHQYRLVPIVQALNKEIKDEKGKPIIKDSRLTTIKKHSEKYKAIYKQNDVCEDFANWWYEKRLLGYVANVKLIDIFRNKKPSLIPVSEALSLPEGCFIDFIGHIDENPTLGTSRTARKSRYAKFYISDETGTMKVMIFNDSLESCKSLNGGLPKEGDIVIVGGSKRGDDTIFANFVAVQQNVIYTKLSELKGETI